MQCLDSTPVITYSGYRNCMKKETFGLISGIVVATSIIPYAFGVYRRTIKPNLMTWSVWSLLGLTLLLTYRSSGAKANIWPAIFGFLNPSLITILALWRGEKTRPSMLDLTCTAIGIAALVIWCVVHESRALSTWALCLALTANTFAAIPTLLFVWKNPDKDRPSAWILYVIGYILALFAISEATFANYLLPTYMITASSCIALPLVRYRLKMRRPFLEWL